MAEELYWFFESLSGQDGGMKVLPYRICQKVKMWLLQFIKD